MMLIVELVTVWCALSVALGLPLARRIRMADAAEYPWRREDPWWVEQAPADQRAAALRPAAIPVPLRAPAAAHTPVPALV